MPTPSFGISVQASQTNPLLDAEGARSAFNERENPEHIDTPAELDQSQDAPHKRSADDIARDLSNPNSPLAQLTIKNTTTIYEGDLPGADGEVGNFFLFQPVFPFPLSEDGTTNFFLRPAFTMFTDQPVFEPGTGFSSRTNLGDIGFDAAIGKSFDSGLILVGGMQGTIPTGVRELSSEQLRLGPEFLGAYLNKEGVVAVFPRHQWTVAGGGPYASASSLQIFAFKFIEGGWTIGTNPTFGYDWRSNEATIPINLTASKVVKIGSVPVKIQGQVAYFVANNDAFGQEWTFTLSVTPVVPNFIYNWLVE